MNREIQIEIAGQRLKLRTDEDEAYMRELAAYVSEQIKALGGEGSGATTLSLVLLSSLRIADEYHKIRKTNADIESALGDLATRVEAAAAGDAIRNR